MSWLEQFLLEAVRRGLCTRIGCTTCGAMDFRRGVIRAAQAATNAPDGWPMPAPTALVIAEAMGHLPPSQPAMHFEVERAVRLLVDDIDRVIGREALRSALGSSWAAATLAAMEKHHEKREAARHAHEIQNDPVKLAQNREAKRQARQDKHASRLARKAECDQERRQSNQPKPDHSGE